MNLTRFLTLSILHLFAILGLAQSPANFVSLSSDEFASLISDTSQVVILDVRRPDEFSAGHIPHALNINVLDPSFSSLCQSQLPKSKTIAVYCRSGRRSKNAAQQLAQLGFSVKELDHGFLSWKGEVAR